MSLVKKVAIIGLGLIGGSLGLALSQGKVAEEVVAIDEDPNAVKEGLEKGAAHGGGTDLALVKGADLVIIATPVKTIPKIARAIFPYLKPGCLVTDVGSTKKEVVGLLEEIFPPGIFYVGGHPMTGGERKGIAAADRYLFENAVYLLTPTLRTNPATLANLKNIVTALGAQVLTLNPEEHDFLVAALSHLPHFLAVALLKTAEEITVHHPQAPLLAAGGFRDLTRPAAGNPGMWRDVYLTNKEMILKVLVLFQNAVEELKGLLASGTAAEVEAFFQERGAFRARLPAKAKGLLPPIYDLLLTVPDRPGVIAHFAGLLGAAGINIIDLEILRVREGEGGSIRLGFQSEEAAVKALAILQENGIAAWRR